MRNIYLIVIALLLSACGSSIPTIKPYKLDIQQGNVVTSKMLLQLKPGMTKSQVRYIMGTPLIQDSFHDKRWDYYYEMREGGKVIDKRLVILTFKNELLDQISGDVVPKAGGIEAPEGPQGTREVQPTVKPEEKGFFDKLKFWKKDEIRPNDEAVTSKAQSIPASAKDKSFFDRLKFWKKDVPVVPAPMPVEKVESLSGVPIVELPEATDQ
jgi:outer membrane protein assembly factor BamE